MSLRSKILLAVTLVMAAVMALLAFNIRADANRVVVRERELRLAFALEVVQSMLSDGVSMPRHPDDVIDVLYPLRRADLLVGYVLVDHRGSVHERVEVDPAAFEQRLVQKALDEGSLQVQGEGEFLVAPVILGTGQRWGTARLQVKIPPPDYPLSSVFAEVFITLAVSAIGLLMVLYVLISRMVLRPIEKLARAANQLALGRYEFEIGVDSREDEIGQLVRAFRSMRQHMATYHQTLHEQITAARTTIQEQERGLMVAQRLAATGTLAAGIAHEVNNPIGGLLNAALSLQRRHPDDPKTVQYLELIIDGLGRIRETVSKVLTFTPREVAVGEVELRAVVEDALGYAKHKMQRRRIEVERTLPDVPAVLGNHNELQQVVLNLVLNAIDAMPEAGGRIAVQLGTIPGGVRLSVTDTGCGMTEEQQAKALDLFFTTKPPGQGTGLGLSIVHNIVSQHRGRLEIQSTLGEGTTVSVELPTEEALPGRLTPAP